MSSRRHFGQIKQRGTRPGYYVVFQHPDRGGPVERFAGPTKAIARQKLAAVEALTAVGRPLAEILAEVFGAFHGSTLTFRKAVPLYLEYAATQLKPTTLKSHTQRLGLLGRAAWAAEVLGRVAPGDLTRWAMQRRQDGASEPTVNRDLNVGSALYEWAKEAGHVEANPFRAVRRFNERGRERRIHLTASQGRALVETASPVVRPFLLAALHTGMRRGELLALRWRAVDLDRGELYVEAATEKSGRGRAVPLTDRLAAVLSDLKARRPLPALDGSDHVFLANDGSPLTAKIVRSGFEAAVRRCEAIPLDKRGKVTLHALRHTAATLMVAARVPILDVARILGHTSLVVTMRYAHALPESREAAIRRLGRALDGFEDDGDASAVAASS